MAEDLAEFARAATLREKPTWAHDAPEVRAWPIARLLDYSAPSGTTAVPTLVLPSQAGHASSIVDYGRDQSQMMTLRDGGLDRLFAIDWLPATDGTADWSIEGFSSVGIFPNRHVGLDAPVGGGRRRRHHPHMPISRIANLTPGQLERHTMRRRRR